jgi:hypothetical protein
MSNIDQMARYLRIRLETLTPEALPDFADELEALAQWIRALDRLPAPLRAALVEAAAPIQEATVPEAPLVPEAPPVPEEARPAPEPAASPMEQADPPRGEEFRRDLRGGILWPAGIRVPEVFVRERQLVTGDRLTYRALPVLAGEPARYHFDIVERGPGTEPRHRVERAFAIIEEEAGLLVVRRTASEGVLPQPVVVPPNDIATLHLRVEDVVDLAYWADAPDTVRVCWLHRTATLPEIPGDESAPTTGKAKPPTVRPKKAPAEPVLAGRRVLVVGNEPRQRQYAEAIALRGGVMEWLSGNEPEDRLDAAIRRVDAAIVLKGHCSHHASETAVALGKAAGIPVRRIGADGIKSVADWAVKLAGPLAEGPLDAEGP